MGEREIEVRKFVEDELRRDAEEEGAAYIEDREDAPRLWKEYDRTRLLPLPQEESGLPGPVYEAAWFYNRSCDDWGGAGVYQIPIGGRETWLVRVTTDGDDGWVEAFEADGTLLGAARTYLELVAWGPQAELRAMTGHAGYPAELADRQERTIWNRIHAAKAERMKGGS